MRRSFLAAALTLSLFADEPSTASPAFEKQPPPPRVAEMKPAERRKAALEHGISSSAQFLYWQTLTGPAAIYAFDRDFPIPIVTTPSLTTPADGLAGTADRQTFPWDPGFRVTAGYEFPFHDSWEIMGQYTWYFTKEKDAFGIPLSVEEINLGLLPTSARPVYPVIFTVPNTDPVDFSLSSTLHYQVADLQVKKYFSPADFMTFTFLLDLQGGWFDQQSVNIVTSLYPQTTTTTFGWKFWGVGPGIGLLSDWYCFDYFAFSLNANYSLLAGTHCTNLKTLIPAQVNLPDQNVFQKINVVDTRFVPHTQLEFSVSWACPFTNSAVSWIKFKAGFELNLLDNLVEVYRSDAPDPLTSNNFSHPINYSIQSDLLQIYGINLGAEIAF